MNSSAPSTAQRPRQIRRADRSRLLPWLSLLVVVLGVPASCVPTKTVVLCDDDARFHHFETLYHQMWQRILVAVVACAVCLITLISKQARASILVARLTLLAVTVAFVVVQDQAGTQAARLGIEIFHTQTCDEPTYNFDVPHGYLQP